MTLAERLNDYKTRNNLSIKELKWKIGISEPTLRDILKVKRPTNGRTILKIVNALGPEFEEYLEYKTCYCGKKFVPKVRKQDCCSSACAKEYNGRKWPSENKNPMHKLKEHEKQKLLDHNQKFPKPQVSFAEYNERARSQGLSYGQLQGLERLGLR